MSTSRQAEGSTRSAHSTGRVGFSVLPLAWGGHSIDSDPGFVCAAGYTQTGGKNVGHPRKLAAGGLPSALGPVSLAANRLLATTLPFVVSSVASESTQNEPLKRSGLNIQQETRKSVFFT